MTIGKTKDYYYNFDKVHLKFEDIDGKKATSEEVAALPPNPKGHIAEDGSVWITTEDGSEKKALTLESNN